MSAQAGDNQTIRLIRQSIDNKVFIRTDVIAAGFAVQTDPYARQKFTQKRKGVAAVFGKTAEGFAILRLAHRLAAVVTSHLQRVVIRRKAVKVATVFHLYRKAGKLIVLAIAAVGLIPGEHFARRPDR